MAQTRVDILLQLNANTRQLLEATRQTAALRAQWMQMFRLGAGFVGVQAGVNGITSAFRKSIAAGVEFNRLIQNTGDSLRAMALAGSAQGNMQAASRESADVLGILRHRANETGETLQSVIGVFQQSASVAAQNGIALRDWAGITIEATRAGGNLGLSIEQIRTNLQQISMGDVSARNVLARAIGLDSETLRAAVDAGNVVDVLRAKLAPFQTEIQGLSSAQNRLSNTMQELWGRVALPLFERMETETNNLAAAMDGVDGSTRSVGIVLADLVSAGSQALQFMIRFGPAVAQLGVAIVSLRLAAAAGRMLDLAMATRSATAATNLLTAAKARLAAAMMFLRANPFAVIATVITAIVGLMYRWQVSSRQLARDVAEIRDSTNRIRESGLDRLASVTSEEQRQGSIRDITAQLLELERRITIEKRAQARAALEGQAEELRRQAAAAQALTPQQIRDNARREAEERRKAQALAALPDNLEEFRKRQEQERIAAMSPEQRVEALQARRDELGEVGDLAGQSAAIPQMREQLAAMRVEAEAAAESWRNALAEEIQAMNQSGYVPRDLTDDRESTQSALQKQQAAIDAAEAELAIALAKAQQIAAIEADLAAAQRELDSETAARRAEIAQLDTQSIQLAEQELKQSYERQGGDVRQHYQLLMALAAERWEREIAAAQEALAQASPAEREAAQLRLSNAQRQRAIELRGIELQRDRELASQSRRAYEIKIQQMRDWIRAVDDALLTESDIAKRTELERRRADLIEAALESFREYQRATEAAGLTSNATAPEFGDAPTRVGRMQRTQDAFARSGGDGYQSLGEGITGGLMEAQMQMGTLWDNVSNGIIDVAEQMRTSIGGAIEGLLTRTMSWGEALRSIGAGFARSMIGAIADIAARWVVEQGLMVVRHIATKSKMFAVDSAFAAKGLALSMANAAKSLVAWIPSAIAASISSFGVAAAVGLAAVVALLAKGFAGGGYTGPGGVHQPAGIVHAGEWVAPQWQVKHPVYGPMISQLEQARMGRGDISYSQRGYMSGGPVDLPMPPSVGGQDTKRPLQIAFFDSRSMAQRFASDPEMETILIDLVKRNRGEVMT